MAVGVPVTSISVVASAKVLKHISNSTVPLATVIPPKVGSVQATVISPGLVPPEGKPITFSLSPAKPKLPTDTYSKKLES